MLKSVSKGTLKGKKRDKIKQSPLPNGADNSYGVTRPFLLCHLEGEEVTASRLRPWLRFAAGLGQHLASAFCEGC